MQWVPLCVFGDETRGEAGKGVLYQSSHVFGPLQNILADNWQNEDSLCGLITCLMERANPLPQFLPETLVRAGT